MASTAPPTMHDIAKAALVSQSTVSNVLNGRGSISVETRNKVLDAAKRMGYRPNLFAAGLRSHRHQHPPTGWPVAVLVFYREDGSWYPNEPLLGSLRDTARSSGFLLQEHAFRKVNALPRLTKMLFARGVRGIVMNPDAEIENSEIDWTRFCVVTCGRWDAPSRFHTVRSDAFSGVTRLWTELAKNGYAEIGAATCRHPTTILDDLEREGAFHAMQARLRKDVRRIPPFLGDHSDGEGFLKWFRKYRPQAVIGFSDLHYHALKNAGYRMPGDCAYASIQGTRLLGEIAGCAEAQISMGKKILRIMDTLIRHHDKGLPDDPETMLVPPVFQPGASLLARKQLSTETLI